MGLMIGGGLAWLILYGFRVSDYGLSFPVVVVWVVPALVAFSLAFILTQVLKGLELRREKEVTEDSSSREKSE